MSVLNSYHLSIKFISSQYYLFEKPVLIYVYVKMLIIERNNVKLLLRY